jgi:hypothetical protein
MCGTATSLSQQTSENQRDGPKINENGESKDAFPQ